MADDYDLLVIGAGSGGVRAARMAANAGARVALMEQDALGGTCVNVGCVPKKLFYYASHLGQEFEEASHFGWKLSKPSIDWPTLRDNKSAEIARLNQVYKRLLDDSGVTLFRGRARILDAHQVECGDCRCSARQILIAAGATPYVPDFPGRQHVVTSNELFSLESLPRRALIVGGGYIAVEFAGIFHGLGVSTELAYRGNPLLRHFDRDLRAWVTEEIGKSGVKVRLATQIVSIAPNESEELVVAFDDGSATEFDLVLYATGRRPNSAGLGLENTAVITRADGAIEVDQYYRTNEPSIFAIGDVIGGPELTPLAIAQAMAVVEGLCFQRPRHVSLENLPTAIFCQPSVGTVGLTEEQARARHSRISVYRSEFRALKLSLGTSEQRTYMKLVVDSDTDRVVGAHMVGEDAGEIIQGIAIALNAGATKKQFDATIGIHPTSAEEFVTMRSASG